MRKRENRLSFFFFFWLCEFVRCEQHFYKAGSPREGGISCDAFQVWMDLGRWLCGTYIFGRLR